METIQEIALQPAPYQEVFLSESAEVLSIKVRPGGVSLFVVMDDLEPKTRPTGIFILPTGDPRVGEIPDDYAFMDTLQFINMNGELQTLHAFIQLIDYMMQEGEFPDED